MSAARTRDAAARPALRQASRASEVRAGLAGPSVAVSGASSTPSRTPARLPLHRRLLAPHVPIDQPLPSIIQAQGEIVDQLNERVYHLIALTLRAYVLSWYPRISPRDRTLLPAICTHAVVPVLSPILTRIHNDPSRLAELLLLDLPAILRLHVETYWSARAGVDLGLASGAATSGQSADKHRHDHQQLALSQTYNARLPLPYIVPSPAPQPLESGTPYRVQPLDSQPVLSPLHLTALADALLRLHLPVKEYGSAVERTMATEILGRTVLGSVGRKLGEAWFLCSLALKLLGDSDGRQAAKHEEAGTASGKMPSATANEWLRRLVKVTGRALAAMASFWSIVISLTALYSSAPPTPPQYVGVTLTWVALGRELLGVDGRRGVSARRWSARLAWGCVELLATLCGAWIDRLLPHLVLTLILTPTTAFRVIDLLERILFPLDGYPLPTPPDPTPTEAKRIRQDLEARLQEVVPITVRETFMPEIVNLQMMLDPFDDAGCNAHLVGMLLNAVIAALEPALVPDSCSSPRTDGTRHPASEDAGEISGGDADEIGQDPGGDELDDAAAVRLAMETPLIDAVQRKQLRMQ